MNTELRLLLEALPHESRPAVEQMWNHLPADVRREAELTLGSFLKLAKKNPTSVTDLLKLLQRSASPMIGEANQVAIIGPVNVGKSTLYNSLIHKEKEKAVCSPVPGTTKTTQSSHTGLFELLDTPGVDHGGESGGEERSLALQAAESAEFLLVVFDAAGSVTASRTPTTINMRINLNIFPLQKLRTNNLINVGFGLFITVRLESSASG